MKVKRENIKLNCEMNNLTNQTFIFAQEIWESERQEFLLFQEIEAALGPIPEDYFDSD